MTRQDNMPTDPMSSRKSGRRKADPVRVQKAARSVFFDLFPENEATELEMRSLLLIALLRWLEKPSIARKSSQRVGYHPSPIFQP
jgi:hypothetical protein